MQRSRLFFRVLFISLLTVCSPLQVTAQADRFFQPTEGFVRAKDLPETWTGKVRSIQLEIKDAFEGTTVHSEAEQSLYDIGNKLHYESRPGTIRRRLLFSEGDTITKGMLLETEKSLRTEEFLADAIIEAMTWNDGTVHIKVTTYDQWTAVPGVSLQRLGGEWIYWFGPVESNLVGTGQRLGFFVGHDQFRDTKWLDYNNSALFPQRLRLSAHAAGFSSPNSDLISSGPSALTSDGYSVLVSLSKPLETRTDRYAFHASVSAVKYSEYVYFDANRFKDLKPSLADSLQGFAHILERFNLVATHDLDLSATRSFGYNTKLNLSSTFNRHDRYNDGTTDTNRYLNHALPIDPSAMTPDVRMDYLVGMSLSVYQYNYKTVQNFNNLKWSETLETGWRISSKIALNQKWMGANNSNFYLSHSAVYNNTFCNSIFMNTGGSLYYFVAADGKLDDGFASAQSEFQWKPVSLTSSIFSVAWSNYFASEKAQQLLLGEDNGLNGFPNLYYAGQARILMEAEQRFFPNYELGTLVPAFALFINAGNTFSGYSDFDPGQLHYSVGFGLRLGASKSVQKVVNHFNLSWPVGEKNLSSRYPVFSIRAKKSL